MFQLIAYLYLCLSMYPQTNFSTLCSIAENYRENFYFSHIVSEWIFGCKEMFESLNCTFISYFFPFFCPFASLCEYGLDVFSSLCVGNNFREMDLMSLNIQQKCSSTNTICIRCVSVIEIENFNAGLLNRMLIVLYVRNDLEMKV